MGPAKPSGNTNHRLATSQAEFASKAILAEDLRLVLDRHLVSEISLVIEHFQLSLEVIPSMTNAIIYLFGSGLAFFIGISIVLLAIVVAELPNRTRLRRLAPMLVLVGAALVALSATPLPYWLYSVLGTSVVVWLVAVEFRQRLGAMSWASITAVFAALWIGAVLLELPYHMPPKIESKNSSDLWIIGDSVTAGTGDPTTTTWPQLFAGKHSIIVHDHSRIGATVGSALRGLDDRPPGDGIVLLEIGGNDLLGNTPASDFATGLEGLLEKVCKPDRLVVMFELPLPPLRNDFGLAQRSLAKKYGVTLIPKRYFVAALTADGMTIDSVHLSQAGHQQMSELVWGLLFGGK
jgi:acyl-CoA thioesterase-1